MQPQQFGMPTSSWIPTSSAYTFHNPSITFQPQIPPSQNQISWPSTAGQPYNTQPYPQSPTNPSPFQAYTTYTQPVPNIPNFHPYTNQTSYYTQPPWTRPQLSWLELPNTQPPPHHTHQIHTLSLTMRTNLPNPSTKAYNLIFLNLMVKSQ
jgi:hypothetical protein